MGGCRCIFRDCDANSKRNRNISFFHLPIKEPKRYERWIEFAKAQHITKLPQSKQKNRVICARHFRDECFMNYKKNSLTHSAVPKIWRLSKNTAIDYENNLESGELVTLEPPIQAHLIAPEHFICPLGFNDECDNELLNRKVLEMSESLQDKHSITNVTSINTIRKVTIEQLTSKQKFSQDINGTLGRHEIKKNTKVLNGYANIRHNISSKKLYIADCEILNNNSSNDGIESFLTSDDNSLTNDILTIDKNLLIEQNGHRNDEEVQDEQNESSFLSPTTMIRQDTIYNSHDENQRILPDCNKTINPKTKSILEVIPSSNIENNYDDTEESLSKRMKYAENTADNNTEQCRTCIPDSLKINMKDYNKVDDNYGTFIKQHRKQQHHTIMKRLQYRQKLRKITHNKRTFNEKYEKLLKENEALLIKCNTLEKILNLQRHEISKGIKDQQKEITFSTKNGRQKSTTTRNSTLSLNCPSDAQLCPLPHVPTQSLSKIQLFNCVKRYISVTMSSLLRMEMFGTADRAWKSDEKQIAVDILRLGDQVYKYFVNECRFRLPPIADVKKWLILSNEPIEENDL